MFESLLELAWKSALVSLLVAALVFLLRRHAAADRARVATVGMALLAALPLVVAFAPRLTVEVAELPVLMSEAEVSAPASLADESAYMPPRNSFNASPSEASGGPVPIIAEDEPTPSLASLLPEMIVLAYGVPAAFLLLHLGAGLIGLVSWSAAATPVRDPAWSAALKHAALRMGLRRLPRLLRSEGPCPPVSYGFVRPTILVDSSCLERFEDAEAVLAHECAHLARCDWPALLLSRTVRALFWFNPVVWWLERELEQSLEEAADDKAIDGRTAGNLKRTAYAQALLNAARDAQMACPANGAGSSSLEQRLTRLFGKRPESAPRLALGALVLCAGVAAPVAALQLAVAETEETLAGEDVSRKSLRQSAEPAWDPQLDELPVQEGLPDPDEVTAVQVGDDPYPPQDYGVTATPEIESQRAQARIERQARWAEQQATKAERVAARELRAEAAEERAEALAERIEQQVEQQVALSEAAVERSQVQHERELAKAEAERELRRAQVDIEVSKEVERAMGK